MATVTTSRSPRLPRFRAGVGEVERPERGERSDREFQLRAAFEALIEHLCADYKIEREKVLSRCRDRGAAFVRGLAYVALREAGYSLPEIGSCFGRTQTTVLRQAQVATAGEGGRRATKREVAEALTKLRATIRCYMATPHGPRAVHDDETERPDEVAAMRIRWDALVARMLEEPKPVALALWEDWCRTEYPCSWQSALAMPPRAFRRLCAADYEGGEEEPTPQATCVAMGDRP